MHFAFKDLNAVYCVKRTYFGILKQKIHSLLRTSYLFFRTATPTPLHFGEVIPKMENYNNLNSGKGFMI